MMYPVYHQIEGCHKIGLYTKVKDPKADDLILASEFFHLDYSPVIAGEPVICGYCKSRMRIEITNIDYDNPVK